MDLRRGLFVASCCYWIEIAEIRIFMFWFPPQYLILRLDCEYSVWNAWYVCASFLLLSAHLYYMKLDANANVNLLSTTALNVAENIKQTVLVFGTNLRSHLTSETLPLTHSWLLSTMQMVYRLLAREKTKFA
jgi:hypothetical protein